MDGPSRLLHQIHVKYAPVDARVAEILEHIRQSCQDLDLKNCNADNERQVEEFITRIETEFPGKVTIQRQRLSRWAVRTTRWNYLFTVPGESDEQVVLVAHYDTWRGPGADDNTTGEEILRQYLLSDLRASARPKLTHVYFFAGSEECGLVGLFSQLLLSFGLFAGNFALTYGDWAMLAVAVALLPLASYRFGVSGSREYVRTLTPQALRRIRAVVSVDSVGEGRLYIPRETMGADFIRVLIPFGSYDSINDLLEEAAHLHGIKYNNFLAGGTTDHVSFLEVNNGLWSRLADGARRLSARLTSRPYQPPLRIPATALVAMRPGKASPIVFGGKIHTPNDTPDRVYAEPLRQTLLILDYFFYRSEGGPRISHPRELDEYHYARLYRSGTGGGHLIAFKDAVEPNRRNLNAVYRARVTRSNGRAVAQLGDVVGWGVESRLTQEVKEVCADAGLSYAAEPVRELEVHGGDGTKLTFGPHTSGFSFVRRAYHEAINLAQGIVRRFLFLTFFALAYLLASLTGWLMDLAFEQWPHFGLWVADHVGITLTAIMLLEVVVLLHLMARRIPAWIDNSYKHANRADNLGSLRRIGATTF